MKLKFKSTKLHIILVLIWVLLMYPTVAFWSESVLWVGIMSCYALAVGHWSSYEAAASAGVDDVTHARLEALAEGMADIMEALIVIMPDSPEGNKAVTKLKSDLEQLRHVVGLEPDSP